MWFLLWYNCLKTGGANVDWFKDYFSPIISLVFSSFAFFFTLKNERNKKFAIKIDYLDKQISELLVDRTSNETPDVYHHQKFRLLPLVVITNLSSYPVTVTEFTLNDIYSFGAFTLTGDNYEVTYLSNAIKIGGGVIHTSDPERKIVYDDLSDKFLKPTFTIAPFESVTGLLFFRYNDSQIGKNNLTIKTSRGSKEFPLQITKQFVSQKVTDYTPPQLEEFFEGEHLQL